MEFSKSTTRGGEESRLPAFMQNVTTRGALNQVLDKSLKNNNYQQSYFVSKPTTLRLQSNSQMSKKRIHDLSSKKKQPTKEKPNNSEYKSYNKATFYKLLSENGFIQESVCLQKERKRDWQVQKARQNIDSDFETDSD